MSVSSSNWYTAYTLPRYEKRIFADLQKRQVEAYLPLQKVVRKWSDRLKKIETPLFPNYIFIKASDLGRGFPKVDGLVSLVSFGGRPAELADDEILTIRQLENETLTVEPTLVEGVKVRIIRGPLAGMQGRLFNRIGRSRFGVHIETLKQSLSIEVSGLHLERI